jgi:hypothetical protein
LGRWATAHAFAARVLVEAERELAESGTPPEHDLLITRSDRQLAVQIGSHLFIVRGVCCPVCCIDRMLDSLRRAIMNRRSGMRALERLSALAVGDRLIELRNVTMEEEGHVVE